MDQGRCLLASDCFLKGLELDPTNHTFHFQLGRARERMNEFEAAIQSYEKAIENSPQPYQIWDSILDFTEDAKEAIMRVRKMIE
jgi:tetratricopeptide (TPR) repeat protein